jgi:hypothetical protein
MDRGKYHTCDLGIYFHTKSIEEKALDHELTESLNSLTSRFRPMPYSKTSNYMLELVYLISSESKLPSKYIHKSINLREVINLRAASNMSNQVTSVSESKITFGVINQLAMFLADRVKNEGLFDGSEEKEPDE